MSKVQFQPKFNFDKGKRTLMWDLSNPCCLLSYNFWCVVSSDLALYRFYQQLTVSAKKDASDRFGISTKTARYSLIAILKMDELCVLFFVSYNCHSSYNDIRFWKPSKDYYQLAHRTQSYLQWCQFSYSISFWCFSFRGYCFWWREMPKSTKQSIMGDWTAQTSFCEP